MKINSSQERLSMFLTQYEKDIDFNQPYCGSKNRNQYYVESALLLMLKKYKKEMAWLFEDLTYLHKALRQMDIVEEPYVDTIIWCQINGAFQFWNTLHTQCKSEEDPPEGVVRYLTEIGDV